MAVTTTSRLGITRWSAGGDPFTRLHMDDSHAAIENKVAIYLQGTASSRPSAGTVGRFHYATDTSVLTYDDGIAWVEVGGVATVVMSTTAPSSPRNGTVWVDTDSDVTVLDASNFIERSVVTTKGDLIVRSSTGPNRLAVGANGRFLSADSTNGLGVRWAAESAVIGIAVSDEASNLTTGTGKVTLRIPFGITLTGVRASLSVASSSGSPTFDIKKNGTSILDSNLLSIDANERTSTTAAVPVGIVDSSLPDDSEVTVDVTIAGTGTRGAKIYLIGNRT